jgi:UPF0755 protein
MTVSGGRGRRTPVAHTPLEKGIRPRAELRDVGELRARRRQGGGRRSGLGWLVVLGVLALFVIFVLPPLFGATARSLAEGNPDLLRLPFFGEAVRDGLGDRLDRPAGADESPVEVVIPQGASAREITDMLVERGLVADRLAFSYILIIDGKGGTLRAGAFTLDRTMTPREVAEALQLPPAQPATRITVALRGGLRIEQVTAYLLTVDNLGFEPADFYELASAPPTHVVADYPMLATLPEGRSLEGYLGSGVFEIELETTAEEFLRILLDLRSPELEPLLEGAPPAVLTSFYEVLTLASIVEAEATLAEERPIIAGVFLNRLDRAKWSTRLLNADPTVVYGNDTVRLSQMALDDWDTYVFWAPPGGSMADVFLEGDLFGFQTYRSRGLPPGPIRSPTVGAVQAVLQPDATHAYLYFVAKNDGSRGHAFAETWEEHLANIEKYQGGGE